MLKKGDKVLVAMSGGVDSSVAAALLLEQGYEVRGLMLKLWSADQSKNSFEKSKEQALSVAKKLGIALDVLDAQDLFLRKTVGFFIESHKVGLTPNPCYRCNREIKWKILLDHSYKLGIGFVSSGHYARLIRRGEDDVELRRAADTSKDQSYVLSGLDKSQLLKILLPLGERHKSEIRAIAHRLSFSNYNQEESQDLCFLAGMKQKEFISHYAPEMNLPGIITNTAGDVIGTHTGLYDYTIGQRKGVGGGNKEALYVIAKDIEKNVLIIGTSADLGSRQLIAVEMNWLSGGEPEIPISCSVKIRYRANPVSCTVFHRSDKEVLIKFTQPVRDAAPGQIAVLYQDDLVIGSGVILQVPGDSE